MNDLRAIFKMQCGTSNLCPLFRNLTITCELGRTVGKGWLLQWVLDCAFF